MFFFTRNAHQLSGVVSQLLGADVFFSAPEYYHLKLPVILLNVKTDQAMLPVGDSALHSI
jgi:hypothetical protein